MIRIIVFIVIFAVFICFMILNLDNKCDISFGFTELSDIPIFLSALSSFTLGMLVTIPMLLTRRKGRKKDELKKPSKKTDVLAAPDELKIEKSPYGID